jgi:hypothetical protein
VVRKPAKPRMPRIYENPRSAYAQARAPRHAGGFWPED